MHTVKKSSVIKKDLKHISKKFPKSLRRIESEIDGLGENPTQGDVVPGLKFSGFEVRKIRLSLREYNIGRSDGLRLWYLVIPAIKEVHPFFVYHKTEYDKEHINRAIAQERIKEIISGLSP